MNDDLVQRKRGRPFRKCSLQETMSPGVSRANGKRCGVCPKHRKGWCTVSARIVRPSDPACEYGMRMIRSSCRRS